MSENENKKIRPIMNSISKNNMLKRSDIQNVIDQYEDYHKVHLRYASYDFCYSYFQQNRGNLSSNMEHSCWVLWGYLASWGMLRGSSELLNLSPAALKPLIECFDELGDTIWDTDVPMYTDTKVVQTIKDVHARIVEILEYKEMNVSATNTLVTKIMMGVFGCVPAYDSYFTNKFRELFMPRCAFRSVNKKSLQCIYDFYISNKTELDSLKINVIDFSGNKTSMTYKIAKLIDMYGFTQGLEIANKKKKTK